MFGAGARGLSIALGLEAIGGEVGEIWAGGDGGVGLANGGGVEGRAGASTEGGAAEAGWRRRAKNCAMTSL